MRTSTDAKNDINMVNAKMAEKVNEVKKLYDAPVAPSVDFPMEIARKLSHRFPTMKFSIEVEHNSFNKSTSYNVCATPEFTPFLPDSDAKEALAALAKIETRFPSFDVVQAYAQGVNDAASAERKMANIKEELKEKEEELKKMRKCMYPYGAFGWR